MNDLDRYATVVLLLEKEENEILFWLAPRKREIHTASESIAGSKLMINGPGGKLKAEDNGSMKECAARETWEEFEVAVEPKDLIFAAKIRFYKDVIRNPKDFFMEVTFFLAWKYSGIPTETMEMGEPKLYSIHTAPFDTNMMPADKGIFSCIMSGNTMEGSVVYAKEKNGNQYVSKWSVAINTPKEPFF